MERLCKKIYYRIEFCNMTSMSIHSGEGVETDNDIVRDSAGLPYIPGSALAGMYRALFEDSNIQNYYFGYIEKAEKAGDETKQSESRIMVYDARLDVDHEHYISNRDCVALDEEKVAIDGSKFDFQIVEPGAKFVCYIEQNVYQNDLEIGELIAEAFSQQRFRIGAKTTRGYGVLKTIAINKKSFTFFLKDQEGKEEKNDIPQWLDFDMYSDKCWEDCDEWHWNPQIADPGLINLHKILDKSEMVSIEAELILSSGINIRRYMTQNTDNNENTPDYIQLFVREKENEDERHKGVIPGTSWAGAFLRDMRNLAAQAGFADEKELEQVFGNMPGKDKRRSQITFSETIFDSSSIEKQVTRNAVNRFSGGTGNGALYTEQMNYGGCTTLVITVENAVGEKIKKLLAGALMDLHYGFLSVGGLTSVGRGLFKISRLKIGGKWVENITYSDIINAIGDDR